MNESDGDTVQDGGDGDQETPGGDVAAAVDGVGDAHEDADDQAVGEVDVVEHSAALGWLWNIKN